MSQLQYLASSIQHLVASSLYSISADESVQHELCTKLARIVAKMVSLSDLDLIFGCGVGGHRQCRARENLKVKDFLDTPFGENVAVSEVDEYIAVYGMTPPPHTMLHGPAEKYEVPGAEGEVDAVITRFDVWCEDTDGTSHYVHIVAGNMHISCGANSPSIKKRMLMVQQLRRRLDSALQIRRCRPCV